MSPSALNKEMVGYLPLIIGILTSWRCPLNKKRALKKSLNIQHSNAEPQVFHTIRSFLLISPKGKKYHCIMISGTRSNVGRTEVAIHLARSLAMTGQKVLLMDTDFRNSSIHKDLSLSAAPGLHDYLQAKRRGDAELVIQTVPSSAGSMDVVTAGDAFASDYNGSSGDELFYEKAFQDFLVEARDKYDYIVLAAPPALIAKSDIAVLSRLSDGVLLVCLPGKTKKEEIISAAKFFQNLETDVIGCILNQG